MVPARPGGPAARHERVVQMQVGFVTAVTEGAEERALVRARVREQGERLVGVRRHDDAIESLLRRFASVTIDTPPDRVRCG